MEIFLGASGSFKLFKNFYFDILFLKSLNIQGHRKKSRIREAEKGVQLLQNSSIEGVDKGLEYHNSSNVGGA